MERRVTQTPARLTIDRGLDHLMALAYGRVVDGKPSDEYEELSEEAALILAEPQGEVIGFVVNGISGLDVESAVRGLPELWEGPGFDVPELGLSGATPGEITAVGLNRCPNSTLDVELFHQAVAADSPEEALILWRGVLATGDQKGHFALGYTLCELGRHREAYAHLRYYTGLTPRNSWAWCWLGHACRGMGERSEAIDAYRTAIELEQVADSYETDAHACLAELEADAGAGDRRSA